MKKICIVTPLKDELSNLPLLIECFEKQSIPIYCWVIVENGSSDGSKEYLDKLAKVKNVENLEVLNFTLKKERYELGFKYSTVVNTGFKELERKIKEFSLESPDYVGICDADCFPPPEYYSELVEFMELNSIDISSGIGVFENGVSDGEAQEWVRGNCRLWKYACFQDAGYMIGPSADTLSLGKAVLRGYKALPNLQLKYKCREMGARSRYSYYGYSSYYRGITPFYAFLKFLNFLKIGQFKQSTKYIHGYFISLFLRKERLNDLELRAYFSSSLSRKIKKRFKNE